MSETNESLAKEKELLKSVQYAPASEKIKTYTKLSGPGWLQGAITLGGGSLGGSLYLGIIGGTELLWLQPLMMMLMKNTMDASSVDFMFWPSNHCQCGRRVHRAGGPRVDARVDAGNGPPLLLCEGSESLTITVGCGCCCGLWN